jgi:lipoprotein-anchoring transpeptidase ErfK/SrfK
VQGLLQKIQAVFAAALVLAGGIATAEEGPSPISILISVPEQKLVVLRDGGLLRKYPISTSKFGVGDSYGSYKTPVGRLRVADKIGDDLTIGAVLNHRQATGEVLPANAKGRDPIVTRIIWLDGTEEQNQNARARGIYIHGTPEESKIGQPVSWGCIRMRSKDVIEVFDDVPVGTPVNIITEKLPRIAKYEPPKPVKAPVIVAARVPAKPPVVAVAPPPAKPPVVAVATPTPAPAKKIAQLPTSTPAPIAAAPARVLKTPVVIETPRPTLTVVEHQPDSPNISAASHALMGSMLMAGLPDGPPVLRPRSSQAESATNESAPAANIAFRAPAEPKIKP